jgi:toxin CcdB
MAQFDVYANPLTALRKDFPYIVDVQSEFLAVLDTRVAVLLGQQQLFLPLPHLTFPVAIADTQFWFYPTQLLTLRKASLRTPAANLSNHRDAILAALDRLITGI